MEGNEHYGFERRIYDGARKAAVLNGCSGDANQRDLNEKTLFGSALKLAYHGMGLN